MNKKTIITGLTAGLAALLLLAQSIAFADAITDRARSLIQQKNPKAAYSLLAPLESQRAGDPEFDYLLGISALDTGEREKAIFAFERVLAVNPKHAQARAEIARAYFELGEKENAKREFQNVRASNPPEGVKRTIDRYLSALETSPTQLSGFLEIGYGYDSNVNSATANSQIAIPAFGGGIATLDPAAVKQSDHFSAVTGGLNLVYGFAPEWAVIAGVAAAGKFNNNADTFDTATLDGNLGLRWSRDSEAITLGYQYQNFQVDNNAFRETNGVVAQWQHNFSEFSQVAPFVQVADLHYPTQTVRDARRTIFGIASGYGWDVPSRPVFFGSLYGGQEKQDNPDFPNLGNKPLGLRLGGQVSVFPRAVLFGSFAYERRNYDGEEPLFLMTRQDKQYDYRLGINYTVAPGWMLIPQAAYTNNKSNIELFAYTRLVATLSVRWSF